MMGWYGGFGGMGVGGLLLMVFIGIVALLLITWVVRTSSPRRDVLAPVPPLDALKRRYANGEITSEEYERARRRIGLGAQPRGADGRAYQHTAAIGHDGRDE